MLKALEQLKGYLRMKQAEPTWYTGLGDVDNLGNALELVSVGLVFPCQLKSVLRIRTFLVIVSFRFVSESPAAV